MTADTGFEASVRNQDGTAVIDLRGLVDRQAGDALAAAYGEAAASGTPIVLNFSGVDYVNSTGIAHIVGILARARADDRSIRAWGLSDHYREIFQITRIADFMAIYDDEAAAVGAA